MSKRNLKVISVLLTLMLLGLFPALPALAGSLDKEIGALKKALLELERRKNEEISELKKRIETLEKTRLEQAAPQKEAQEVKQSVATLKSKVDDLIEKHKLKAGLWLQTWYQFVQDGKGAGTKDLHDFMLRRFYFHLKGEILPKCGFFSYIAADRLGQAGLDQAGLGLGTGLAVRDAWIYYNFADFFKVQFGRMYIPFTRNYGTTSTLSLLPLELTFNQGGVRGGIFYASKVGRDDGLVCWGNLWGGKLQYRLGLMEGVEGDENPADNLRVAGRLSLSLLDPETDWFNQGTNLGKKKVLSLGAGFDWQNNLTLGNRANQDNLGWTVDLFFDHPAGSGAVTLETAYIKVKNLTQTLRYSWLTAGDDAQIFYVQGGYLLPWNLGPWGKFQPYFRYERLFGQHKPDTSFPCVGLNYLLKDHHAKFSVDWTGIIQQRHFAPRGDFSGRNQSLVTVQGQVGF